jgi:hypothetical protein
MVSGRTQGQTESASKVGKPTQQMFLFGEKPK